MDRPAFTVFNLYVEWGASSICVRDIPTWARDFRAASVVVPAGAALNSIALSKRGKKRLTRPYCSTIS